MSLSLESVWTELICIHYVLVLEVRFCHLYHCDLNVIALEDMLSERLVHVHLHAGLLS